VHGFDQLKATEVPDRVDPEAGLVKDGGAVQVAVGIPPTVLDRAVPMEPPKILEAPWLVPTLSQYWDTLEPGNHSKVVAVPVSSEPLSGLRKRPISAV
jgi:hypothetical protein